MEFSFQSVHDKLINQLRKDLYYCDMNDIMFDYEFISTEDVLDNVTKEKEKDNSIISLPEDEEVIDVISENQIMISDNIKKNRSVLINTSHFLSRLFGSFKCNFDRITSQFDLDFPRSSLYYNQKKYTKEGILNIFNFFSRYSILISNQTMPFDKFLMMICTQGSFAFSFILMSHIYNSDIDYHFVTSYDASYNVHSSHNIINIELKAIYCIKNTKTNIVRETINITTKIDLIRKNKIYEPSETVIVFWNITKK